MFLFSWLLVDPLTLHSIKSSALHIVHTPEEERKKCRDRVGRGGMSSVSSHGDGKSESRLFPKPEKHLGWRSWANPSQGGLGREARETGGGPTGAEN